MKKTTILLIAALLCFYGMTYADFEESIIIDSKSNIFASGYSSTDLGILPQEIFIGEDSQKIITFKNITGQISPNNGTNYNGPDGGTVGSSSNIYALNGISGIIHDNRTFFLVGVFLDDSEPTGITPPRMDFTNGDELEIISPVLHQTFYIGDGLTKSGLNQMFIAPSNSTRLFLGIADANSFKGNPCCYEDNIGEINAIVQIKVSNECYTQADLDAKYQEGYNAWCTSCSDGTTFPATISPELKMHIPVLQYVSPFGTMDLWADFEFAGESNGDMLWKLSDFGQN